MKQHFAFAIACAFAMGIAAHANAQTTTVIAHGYTQGSKGAWVQGMCEAILARAGGVASVYRYTGATGVWTHVPGAGGDGSNTNVVLIFNWVPESAGAPGGAGPNWNYVQAAGDALYAMLRDAKYAVGSSGPGDLVTGRALHLIGHSRGACVMSETARRFALAGITVDQVTTHDPHPVNGTLDSPFNFNWGDPVPVRWNNITWADNYWRADGGGIPNGFDFDGISLSNVHNINLNESALNCCANSLAHLDVHLWYHGTIDLSPTASDGEQDITAEMRTTWWLEPPPPIGYTLRGYYYSVLGGGSAQRPAIPPGVDPPAGSAPILYNGDFPQGTYAGWAAHGGAVGGQITTESGNGYLRLGPGAPGSSGTHNRFFLPGDADAVQFDYRIYTAGSGLSESLEVRLSDEDGGTHLIGSIALNAAGGWIKGHVMPLIPEVSRGRNHTLRFAIASAGSIEAVVGVDDILITTAPLCAADLNGSGAVDIDDLLTVINAWGSTSGAGDVDGSGVTDIDDLLLVINSWGPCP